MHKAYKVLIPVAGLTLLLSGCGKSTPAATESQAPTAAATESAAASTGFGNPVTMSDGVVITVKAPVKFTPSKFASNAFPGQETNSFEVTIANKSKAAVDLSGLIIEASSNGNSCNDILDGDSGLAGAPTDPLAVNGSVTFKYGFGCDAKAGDPIDVTVSIDPASTTISGKLA